MLHSVSLLQPSLQRWSVVILRMTWGFFLLLQHFPVPAAAPDEGSPYLGANAGAKWSFQEQGKHLSSLAGAICYNLKAFF